MCRAPCALLGAAPAVGLLLGREDAAERCLQANLPLLPEGSSTLALRGVERCLRNGQGDWPGFWRVSPWVDAETPTPLSSANGWHIP